MKKLLPPESRVIKKVSSNTSGTAHIANFFQDSKTVDLSLYVITEINSNIGKIIVMLK